MSQELCDYQGSDGFCHYGPGKYCEGHSEREKCRLFLVPDGPGPTLIWASSAKTARFSLDIGKKARNAVRIPEGIIDITSLLNKELIIALGRKYHLKPEDLVN